MHQSIPSVARVEPRAAAERTEQLAMLTHAITDDMLGAIGLGQLRRGRRILDLLCRGLASNLARKVIAYDDQVGVGGLRAGGAWALREFVVRLEESGAEHIPRSGPVLIVANHPGLSDAPALFTAINRPDLRVVAADRLLLRALPNTSRHLLYIDRSAASRFGAVRAVTRHLRAGGAVLTFPAGKIEPDPVVLDGAEQSLDSWSDSIEALARLAPGISIVPAIIGGVLSPAALRHPLTALRSKPRDRHWLAAMLQMLLRSLQGVTVHVAFGRALRIQTGEQAGTLIKAEARRLLGVVGSSQRRPLP